MCVGGREREWREKVETESGKSEWKVKVEMRVRERPSGVCM